MENKQKLLSSIVCYTDGAITLGDLEDWYVPKIEELIDNPETVHFIVFLELLLAEFQDGLITEEEMKDSLKNMLKEGYWTENE